MEQGFIKANSSNLPRIDLMMLGEFLASNKDFCSAEFRNVKTSMHSDYAGPINDHDHHVLYSYEPSAPSHGHVATSKHNYGSGHHKSGASMSALTLLAFLFFLHILQQCIKDHMADMSATQPVVVMTAGRESDDTNFKSIINKIDKTGITKTDEKYNPENEPKESMLQDKKIDINNSYDYDDPMNKKQLTKVHITRYDKSHKQYASSNANHSSYFAGYVNAMDAQ